MQMKRALQMLTVATVMAALLMFAGPASAQGEHTGCRAFGQNIAGLATTLGGTFGQTAAASAPLNDTVETEQTALCESK